MDIIVATGNQHKLEELQALLADLQVRLHSLSDVPDCPPIVEDGATFTANALIKARTVARHTDTIALADDSGLAVDALGGRPGVHSARFAGPDADDAANNALLLDQLAQLPDASRAAQFRCVIAVVAAGGRELVVEGRCPGRIIDTPRGTNGFGYDPLFFYAPAGKTFAELEPAEKNRISHRSRAAAALRQQLPAFLASLPG